VRKTIIIYLNKKLNIMMKNLKETLATIVAKFESEEIVVAEFKDYTIGEGDDSIIVRVEGEELEVGKSISIVAVDVDGVEQVTPLEDGEIVIEDKVIVVVDGVVSEVKEVEDEEEVIEDEVMEDEAPVASEFSIVVEGFEKLAAKIEDLQSELKELKEANVAIKSDLAEFAAQPAAIALEVPKKLKSNMSVTDILKNK
jgi:hypothetical protein